jgi:hypothetical protein
MNLKSLTSLSLKNISDIFPSVFICSSFSSSVLFVKSVAKYKSSTNIFPYWFIYA